MFPGPAWTLCLTCYKSFPPPCSTTLQWRRDSQVFECSLKNLKLYLRSEQHIPQSDTIIQNTRLRVFVSSHTRCKKKKLILCRSLVLLFLSRKGTQVNFLCFFNDVQEINYSCEQAGGQVRFGLRAYQSYDCFTEICLIAAHY